jgi:endonuclease-3
MPKPRPRPAPSPAPEPRALALEVHARLCREYGCPIAYFQSLGPLEELVSSFLNHRTRNRDAKAAYARLRAALPSWEEVRDAPVEEVERLIAGVRWPEAKAPRLQEILREIAVRRGSLSLDFLAEMPVPEARDWLERIGGVGPKTSAAVLSFSTLRRAALPVDSHHHRVAQRLGLIPPKMAVGPSHAALAGLLPPDWTAQEVYDHHEILMLHGQRVCH